MSRRCVCLLDSYTIAASHGDEAAVESEDGNRLVVETSETRAHSRPSQSIGNVKGVGKIEVGSRKGRTSLDIGQKARKPPREKRNREIT